jgi:hypothetical protein
MTRFFIASIAALLLATECAPPFPGKSTNLAPFIRQSH